MQITVCIVQTFHFFASSSSFSEWKLMKLHALFTCERSTPAQITRCNNKAMIEQKNRQNYVCAPKQTAFTNFIFTFAKIKSFCSWSSFDSLLSIRSGQTVHSKQVSSSLENVQLMHFWSYIKH